MHSTAMITFLVGFTASVLLNTRSEQEVISLNLNPNGRIAAEILQAPPEVHAQRARNASANVELVDIFRTHLKPYLKTGQFGGAKLEDLSQKGRDTLKSPITKKVCRRRPSREGILDDPLDEFSNKNISLCASACKPVAPAELPTESPESLSDNGRAMLEELCIPRDIFWGEKILPTTHTISNLGEKISVCFRFCRPQDSPQEAYVAGSKGTFVVNHKVEPKKEATGTADAVDGFRLDSGVLVHGTVEKHVRPNQHGPVGDGELEDWLKLDRVDNQVSMFGDGPDAWYLPIKTTKGDALVLLAKKDE